MPRYLITEIFCYFLSSTFAAATLFSTLQFSIFFLFFFNCLELQLVPVDMTLLLPSYTTMQLCTWRSHNIQLDANLGIANIMSKEQWLTQKKFQGVVWKIKREFFEIFFWKRHGDGRPYNNVPMSALAKDWRRWGRETGTRDGFWKLEFWRRAEEEEKG